MGVSLEKHLHHRLLDKVRNSLQSAGLQQTARLTDTADFSQSGFLLDSFLRYLKKKKIRLFRHCCIHSQYCLLSLNCDLINAAALHLSH